MNSLERNLMATVQLLGERVTLNCQEFEQIQKKLEAVKEKSKERKGEIKALRARIEEAEVMVPDELMELQEKVKTLEMIEKAALEALKAKNKTIKLLEAELEEACNFIQLLTGHEDFTKAQAAKDSKDHVRKLTKSLESARKDLEKSKNKAAVLLNNLKEQFAEARKAENEYAQEKAALESKSNKLAEDLDHQTAEITSLKRNLDRSNSANASLEGELEAAKARADQALVASKTEALKLLAKLDKQKADANKAQAELTQDLQDLKASKNVLESELAAKNKALDDALTQIKEIVIEKQTAELKALNAKLVQDSSKRLETHDTVDLQYSRDKETGYLEQDSEVSRLLAENAELKKSLKAAESRADKFQLKALNCEEELKTLKDKNRMCYQQFESEKKQQQAVLKQSEVEVARMKVHEAGVEERADELLALQPPVSRIRNVEKRGAEKKKEEAKKRKF
uniref:HMMR_C domain-containing protein n=1 Tax=Caenorhabditis tropicalis TaxID=1561998 RepID=A0A1I7U305_9PELO